jgi:hypothetical protein
MHIRIYLCLISERFLAAFRDKYCSLTECDDRDIATLEIRIVEQSRIIFTAYPEISTDRLPINGPTIDLILAKYIVDYSSAQK